MALGKIANYNSSLSVTVSIELWCHANRCIIILHVFGYNDVMSWHLTYCALVGSFTAICWTSPFVISGGLGLFCHIY